MPSSTPPEQLDFAILHQQLTASGLNAIGIADGAPWRDVLDDCQSVVVVGSGGPALFEGFSRWLQARPSRLETIEHPLDHYVSQLITEIDPKGFAGHPSRRWVPCAAGAPPIDFRRLALQAGLGWLSRTGLLLHPTHGLWLGLRAALFTTQRFAPTGPAPTPSPCEACHAPCITACPGGAMSAAVSDTQTSAWDWRTCARYRPGKPCQIACDVRNACPEGTASRYPIVAQHYHNDPAGDGRTALASALGLSTRAGVDPGWEDDS